MRILCFFCFLVLASSSLAQSTESHPELVGKWCYISPVATSAEALTNSCLTLNSDNTYEIQIERTLLPKVNSFFPGAQESDYGTWSVTGNRIFYESTTQGKGSLPFAKANHPRADKMAALVFQGVFLGAATLHEPW